MVDALVSLNEVVKGFSDSGIYENFGDLGYVYDVIKNIQYLKIFPQIVMMSFMIL